MRGEAGRWRWRAVAWAAAWVAATAWAQSADEPLPAVVVTGARSERAPNEVPATIDVLGGEALNPAEVQDIRDLVRDLPNVSVRRAAVRFSAVSPGGTGREGNAGFNIRGLEGNRVLLLVDGVRMPRELVSGVFGSAAFGRDYYDMGLIDRVEIQRGAASALYGSDGLAGIVAMQTIQPQALLQPGATLGGRAVMAYDEEDRHRRLGLTVAGRASEAWSWLGAVQLGRARELDNQGTVDAPNSTRTRPNPERMEQSAVLAKAVWQPDARQRQQFTVEHLERDGRVEALSGRSVAITNASSVADLDGTLEMRRTRVSWDGRWRLNAAWADEMQVLLAWQQARAQESAIEFRPLQPAATQERERTVRYGENLWQASWQAQRSVSLGKDWGVRTVYGLDLTRTELDNLVTGRVPPSYERYPLKRFPDTVERNTALFVQTEWASEAFSVIPALRWDRVELDARRDALYPRDPASLRDDALSPKLGMIWRYAPGAQLYANWAAGFRAPGALQLNNFFENLAGAGFAYRTIPNPSLKPETSRTLELGWRRQGDTWQTEAVVFRGRYRDFIEDLVPVSGVGTASDPITYQAVNRDRVTLRGVEFKVRWSITPLTTLRAAYGLTKGTVDTTGRPLNSVNPPELVVGVEHRLNEAWTLGATARHVWAKRASDVDASGLSGGPFLPPSFTTLDVRARWRIDRDWQLSATVRNIADRKYWEWTNVRGLSATLPVIDAYSAPGRAVSVALTRTF